MIDLTTEQNNALLKPVARTAYFAEFSFKTSTIRVSTLNKSIVWGGHEWTGLGTLAGVSEITVADNLDPVGLSFTLNISDPSVTTLAIQSVEEYRGRPSKMYMCPMDASFKLIGTPVVCWAGIMDAMTVGVGANGSGSVTLKCENSIYALKRQPILRLNSALHKTKFPDDKGLEYLEDLIANPQVWLTKRFQRIK